MDKPEYILVDEIGIVVEAVRVSLGLPKLNYRYGYLKELNETLNQQNADPADPVKYPLIWLMQPLNITRGIQGFFGIARGLRIFIINEADKDWKAEERMAQNFKTILYPIYRELLVQFDISPVFATQGVVNIKHKMIDRYWTKDIGLDDTIDCVEVGDLELPINQNQNCTPLNS